ncbi:MAG: YybH family protein [Mycobacterium sp.]
MGGEVWGWRVTMSVMVAAVLVGCGGADQSHDPERDKAAIESALRQWPNDFNSKNAAGVCGLFADDVVLSYPDAEDRGHGEFCMQMQKLFDDPVRRYSYAPPDIREVLVDGDLATVRLFWTLTVTDAAGKVLDRGVEDGLDVFTRQPDGSWKIHVSHAFTKS